MGMVSLVSMVWFQGADGVTDHMQWLVIFVGVIAFCSFVQFLVVVGAAIGALKAYKSVTIEINQLKLKALPMVATVQGFMNDATPKVRTLTDNAVFATDFVKSKLQAYEGTLDEANQTLKEVNNKTRAQITRVDGMVSSTLKATSDIGTTIHHGIRAPIVEVAGIVNGVKAALDVLVGKTKAFTGESGSPSGGRHTQSSGPQTQSSGPYEVPRPGSGVAARAPVDADPSSSIAPSPGAQEVVDRFRASEKIKTIS